jgi:hypothetical protein
MRPVAHLRNLLGWRANASCLSLTGAILRRLGPVVEPLGAVVTAQPIERPAGGARQVARDPAAVRAALARHADDATLALYDREIGQAYLAAIQADSLEPLITVVDRWWRIAQAAENPAPRGSRVSREEAIASWEARHGQKLGA